MTLSLVLLVVLVLLCLGALPVHSYSAGWGYAPSSLVAVLAIILVVLIATGRL